MSTPTKRPLSPPHLDALRRLRGTGSLAILALRLRTTRLTLEEAMTGGTFRECVASRLEAAIDGMADGRAA